MSHNYPLNLIYSFSTNGDNDYQYKISYFFSQLGYVQMETNQKVYTRLFPDRKNILEGFSSLQEIETFAQEICKETGAPEVFILSNHDYNATMDTINNVRDFLELFGRYGTSIKNPNAKNGKPTFLSNIFS